MRYRESDIQKMIVRWACFKKVPLVAIPNGAHTTQKNRNRLVSEGLSKGFPDLFLFQKNSEYAGLAIEVKTPTGVVRPEQREWLKKLNEYGYKAIVVRSAIEGIEAIEEYLKS